MVEEVETAPAHGDEVEALEREGEDPPFRRRRRIALLVVALLAGGTVAALVAGGGSDGEKKLTPAERAQLEAAAPGSAGKKGGLSAPPAVRQTIAQLTLPQQVAQLFLAGLDGQYPRDPGFAALRKRGWGGVVLTAENFVDAEQMSALTGEIGVVARDSGHLPPLITADQPGGPASAFPDLPPRAQPLVGDSGRSAIARSQARKAAGELRALGVRMTLAPVADVGTAAGPVQDRVFSDDPAVVSAMVGRAVDAYRRGGVIPAVGHFPGAGGASDDPNFATATVGLSLPELRARDLRPFAAVAGRVPVVVVSNAVYAAWDGVTPAVASREIVGGLLRRDLKFRGVVMTDDLSATAPALGQSVGAATVTAFLAGSDLLYVSGGVRNQERAYQALLRAVRKGRISRDRVRLSLTRVLTLKRRYGLLPNPRRRQARRAVAPSTDAQRRAIQLARGARAPR